MRQASKPAPTLETRAAQSQYPNPAGSWGTYDSETPIVLGEKIASVLQNAKLLPFRGYGHVLIENCIPCAVESYTKFLD